MSEPAPRIAFQGVFGAFSHEACLACRPDGAPRPYPSFQAAFEAVAQGDCGFAFVPVENSTAGAVPEVAALLPESGLDIVSEHAWPVKLQLMAGPGATLETIRTVASHPMALKQCVGFLSARGLAAQAAYDTAGAAMELAASPDPSRAAAASRAAAELYGLTVLAADIQDGDDNVTRFVLLARPAWSATGSGLNMFPRALRR